MLVALPFLPPADIVAAFEMLSQHHLIIIIIISVY